MLKNLKAVLLSSMLVLPLSSEANASCSCDTTGETCYVAVQGYSCDYTPVTGKCNRQGVCVS